MERSLAERVVRDVHGEPLPGHVEAGVEDLGRLRWHARCGSPHRRSESTHPIEMPVNHPDEVDELFDAISYNKGGSVLDMIHQYIGFETFRQGISIYLSRHGLSNTQTGDLWDAIEEACRANGSDIPVRRIMDAWVFTPGHPVVSVERGEKPGTIKVSQQQFQFISEEQSTSLWPIR